MSPVPEYGDNAVAEATNSRSFTATGDKKSRSRSPDSIPVQHLAGSRLHARQDATVPDHANLVLIGEWRGHFGDGRLFLPQHVRRGHVSTSTGLTARSPCSIFRLDTTYGPPPTRFCLSHHPCWCRISQTRMDREVAPGTSGVSGRLNTLRSRHFLAVDRAIAVLVVLEQRLEIWERSHLIGLANGDHVAT